MYRVDLSVRTCELFLCFVPFVFLGFIVLTSLFSLFYVTGELKSSSTEDEPVYHSMCAFKEEEQSVLVSVTLMRGITGFKELRKQHVLYMKGPTMQKRLERKISFLFLFVCLFIYLFCHQHFSFYSFSFFWLSTFFSFHIFPSTSAIRRYPVCILQTPKVYSQNYLLECNDTQQELHDLYNARQDSLSNGLRTGDQPLHHE